MTNEQTMTLVLKDAAGNYFLVPQETLEQGRVPEEQKTEVERLMAEAAPDDAGEDVRGHVVPLFVAGALAFGLGLSIGYDIAKAATAETGELKGLKRR